MMKLFLFFIAVFTFSAQAQELGCSESVKRGAVAKNDTVERVKVLIDGIELQAVLKCIKREDFLERLKGPKLSAKTKLAKGQVLKIPLAKTMQIERGFSLSMQHLRSTIDASVYSRTIQQSANLVLLAYEMVLRPQWILLLAGGVKHTNAELEEGTSNETISDLGPTGSAVLIYKQSAVLDFRTFYEFDRYVVIGDAEATDVNYSVAMKHAAGAGTKYKLSEHFALAASAGAVLPSKNTSSSIESGYQAKLELSYSWKKLEFGLSYQKQKIKTEDYEDDGSTLGVALRYQF